MSKQRGNLLDSRRVCLWAVVCATGEGRERMRRELRLAREISCSARLSNTRGIARNQARCGYGWIDWGCSSDDGFLTIHSSYRPA